MAQSTVAPGNPGYVPVTLAENDFNLFVSYSSVAVTTVDTGTAYGTLKAAFDAINAGAHTGAIEMWVNADTTESASAVLNASGTGAANYASIVIQPNGGARTISRGTALSGVLIDLNGADFVTIDGRQGGAGTTQDLVLENNDTSSAAATLRFGNDAAHNEVRYAKIKGANASSTGGVVIFGGSAAGTGNDDNVICNCDIGDSSSGTPANLVYSAGSTATGKENSGNFVQDSNLFNFFQAGAADATGIKLMDGNTAWTISGNSFYKTVGTVPTAPSMAAAIRIDAPAGGGFVVSGNYIGGQGPQASVYWWAIEPGSATRFTGIRLRVGTDVPTEVQGNTIAKFAWHSTSGANTVPGMWCGIYLESGSVNVGTTQGNTLGSGTGTYNNLLRAYTTGAISFGVCSSETGSGTVDIENNTIGAFTIEGSSTDVSHGFIGIYGAYGTVTVASNTVGSATTGNSVDAATKSRSATPQVMTGIHVATNGNSTVQANLIANLRNNYEGRGWGSGLARPQTCGIYASAGANAILNNTVRNVFAASGVSGFAYGVPLVGISVFSAASGSQVIANNQVHTLRQQDAWPTAGSGSMTGISLYSQSTVGNVNMVAGNFVRGLSAYTGMFNAYVTGIYLGGGYQTDCYNNMVQVGLDEYGFAFRRDPYINGIDVSGRANIYHNTVYVGGASDGATGRTAALYSHSSNLLRVHQNNVWINVRTSAVGGWDVAVYIEDTLPSPAHVTADHNLYYAPGSGPALVRNGTTNYYTLAAWKAASGLDAHSVTGDPLLVNPAAASTAVDLHIQSGSGYTAISSASNAGTPSAIVTTDYDGTGAEYNAARSWRR